MVAVKSVYKYRLHKLHKLWGRAEVARQAHNLEVVWFESHPRKNNNETLPPRGVVWVTLNMFRNNVLKGQVLSPVKVCEESEVTTNIQLYEIKQMSFTIKLYL